MIMPNLSVKDVRASADFYVNKLGFEQRVMMDGPDGNPVFAIVELGQAMFGLGIEDRTDMSAPLGNGVQFIVYVPEATNIDSYYDDVRGRGAKIDAELKDAYWGDRVFSVRDPDGYHLTLAKTVRQVSDEEIQAHMKNPTGQA